jgi:hypothetical protein
MLNFELECLAVRQGAAVQELSARPLDGNRPNQEAALRAAEALITTIHQLMQA